MPDQNSEDPYSCIKRFGPPCDFPEYPHSLFVRYRLFCDHGDLDSAAVHFALRFGDLSRKDASRASWFIQNKISPTMFLGN